MFNRFQPFRGRNIVVPEQNIDYLHELYYSISRLDQVATPIRLKYKDVEIRILEVSKQEMLDHTEYFVVVQFKKGDLITRPFTIYCENIDEFIRNLRIELIRFRFFEKLLRDTLESLSAKSSI